VDENKRRAMALNNANFHNPARRFFIFLFLGVLLLGAFAALWLGNWLQKGPLETSGGLYFPTRLEIAVPHFLQGDPQWGSQRLAATSESLEEAGCAVASAAMVLAAHGLDVDPGSLNAFLQKTNGGYTPQGWIYWEKAAEIDPEMTAEFLPHYEDDASHFLIDSNLLRGNPIIARVRYPSGVTHFVVVCGKEGFEYLVRDPGAGGAAGITRLSSFPGPVEALRFYRKPEKCGLLDGGEPGR